MSLLESLPQTCQTVEIIATLWALQHAPREQNLTIRSSKKSVRTTIMVRLGAMEDRGWIGIPDKKPLQALVAELRARGGTMSFLPPDQKEDRHILTGRSEAAILAKTDCDMLPKEIRFDIDPTLRVLGAKLATLTQATAYAGIKERRVAVRRKATDNNINLIKTATQHTFHRLPTTPQIWKSIRNRDFSRQVKKFLWKSTHSAHRIGKFWKHIPDCKHRATCQFCQELEDLEHILLKCRRPGQAQIWASAKDLWLRKYGTIA
ncbi:hypothetical protein C8F04DRAFT_1179254 [Mycena alexandri]|uniref:Reverse transcriptase zinc-binding domain-containing protein n=1 Tax=Mycena alexandri TaxID=1745969 RepID=A0AAD6X4P4_9AGAR|nr:hypothetical protein C8F04DRAFT_1179254 [Mycena alexandri]